MNIKSAKKMKEKYETLLKNDADDFLNHIKNEIERKLNEFYNGSFVTRKVYIIYLKEKYLMEYIKNDIEEIKIELEKGGYNVDIYYDDMSIEYERLNMVIKW